MCERVYKSYCEATLVDRVSSSVLRSGWVGFLARFLFNLNCNQSKYFWKVENLNQTGWNQSIPAFNWTRSLPVFASLNQSFGSNMVNNVLKVNILSNQMPINSNINCSCKLKTTFVNAYCVYCSHIIILSMAICDAMWQCLVSMLVIRSWRPLFSLSSFVSLERLRCVCSSSSLVSTDM